MGGKPRIRRTAEEAKQRILDAAEAQLRVRGPDGLRLEKLAAEVGVSHPAILHHFGNRAGLVEAVLARSGARIKQQIDAALSHELDVTAGATLLDRVFRSLADSGHARMFAWLFLTQEGRPRDPVGFGHHLREIAEVVHRKREQRLGDQAAAFEDTLFTVLLAALALFGNAIAGEPLRRSAGLEADPDADRRFVVFLAELLRAHLETPRAH